MKKIVLLLASTLIATSSFAQYITPEEVPISEELIITDCWGMGVVDNQLILTGNTLTNKNLNLFGPYLHFDGIHPIEAVANNIMQNVEVGNISNIENPPFGKYYFSGWGADTGGIYTWDGKNPVEKIISHEPNSSGFKKGVTIGSKIYYAQYNNGYNIWVFDAAEKSLIKLTNEEYHTAKLKVYKGKVYIFEYHKPNYLHCYNPETGQFTDIETGLSTDEKTYIYRVNIVGDKLVFILHTATLGMELYSYDGKGSVQLVDDFAKGEIDGIGSDAAVYHGKLYFAGNTSKTEEGIFDLYRYNPTTEKIEQVKQMTTEGNYGSYPHIFHVAFDKLYFTARSDADGQQLHEYNDATDELKQLTNMPKEDGIAFYPMDITTWDNHIYFSAYSGRGSRGANALKHRFKKGVNIYRLKPEQNPTTIHNTRITTVEVTAHPNPTANNTTLSIALPKASKVHLIVTDATGRQVHEHHALATQQRHSITVPMQELAAGVYLYQLTNERGRLLHSSRIVKK